MFHPNHPGLPNLEVCAQTDDSPPTLTLRQLRECLETRKMAGDGRSVPTISQTQGDEKIEIRISSIAAQDPGLARIFVGDEAAYEWPRRTYETDY